MYFKYPQILYALFLLVIPILVHLFQLRKFKIEYFTNVKFLKDLQLKTRKSSQIKKWLLLLTRLLLLAALIIAFAQPYFKDKTFNSNSEYYIVLDNSFSMQAKGSKGELLKRAVQEILEYSPEEKQVSVLTNDTDFYDVEIKSIVKELQQLTYSAYSLNLEQQLQKIKNRNQHLQKQVLVITDGVITKAKDISQFEESIGKVSISIQKAENYNNVAIDSVYLDASSLEFNKIKVKLKAFGEAPKQIPIALYNQKEIISKSIVSDFSEVIEFTIPKDEFNGYVEILDKGLNYDDKWYFSIEKANKSKVIAIGNSEKNSFLNKIFTSEEFEFQSFDLNTLPYNLLEDQNTIILNEIEHYPQALIATLKQVSDNGTAIVFIPNHKVSVAEHNEFLSGLNTVRFSELISSEQQLTKIAFDHPLFKPMFEKKVTNFQYPKVSQYYSVDYPAVKLMSFADDSPFMLEKRTSGSSVYVFTSSLAKEITNFSNSPLIVLGFYGVASNVSKSGLVSFNIGTEASYTLDLILSQNDVITVKNETEDFIPSQQILSKKVKLNFNENPVKSGNFTIYNKKEPLANISFNYLRSESDIQQINSDLISEFNSSDIASFLDMMTDDPAKDAIWKWFIYLMLLFLLIEIFIQKFIR